MNTARNGVVTYNIDLDDEYVRVVVQSVKPDTIIFLGAYDDGHSWQDYHRASAKYISALTNILVSASDLGVKKFIYLSTINVYGFKNFGVVTEDFPAAPSNVKSIIVSQGERLCMEFTQNGKIDATILRFGQIYGDIKSQNLQLDYVIKKCLDALTDGKLIANNQSFPLIHMNDAVIAVYKSSYLDAPSGIYNVCDDATVTDEEICGIISECYADLNIPIERDQRFVAQDYSISGEKFNKSYSFFQKVKFKEGIAAVAAYVRENQAKLSQLKDKAGDTEEEKGRRWAALRYLGKKAIPYTLSGYFP